MGSIVKGVSSLFGGGKRRREQKRANAGLKAAQAAQDKFRFKNVYEGLQGPQFGGYDAAQGQAAQQPPSQGDRRRGTQAQRARSQNASGVLARQGESHAEIGLRPRRNAARRRRNRAAQGGRRVDRQENCRREELGYRSFEISSWPKKFFGNFWVFWPKTRKSLQKK